MQALPISYLELSHFLPVVEEQFNSIFSKKIVSSTVKVVYSTDQVKKRAFFAEILHQFSFVIERS